MTLSLRARLFLGHGLVLVAALVVLGLLAAQAQRRWILDSSGGALEQIAGLLAERARGELRAEGAAWTPLARGLAAAGGMRVTLIAADGRVLGDSEVPAWRLPQLENHAGRDEVRAALAGRSGRAVRRSHTIGRDLLYVAVPMRADSIAVLRVAEPLVVIDRMQAGLLGRSVAVAAVAALLALALAYAVAGRQTRRVHALAEVAARLGSDPGARAREQPSDEIGKLGRALNQMASELRARLDALENERDAREAVLAHLNDGVALLDPDGRVRHMNHRFAELLGAPRPAPIGTPFPEFARAPDLDGMIQRARSGGTARDVELRLWAPRPRLLRVSVTPLGAGPGVGVLCVLHDLTEVETLNRVRQDFVANVSHELRTPLTSLRGYTETLLEGGLDDPENREAFVRIIRAQTVRLQALVEDLLSLADLERPGAQLRLEPLDLRVLVADQAAAFREPAARAGLSLEVEPGPPAPLTADRARLEQVLANLLDNAVKYTERGGIRARAGIEDAVAWCEIEDSGPGIADDERPRIFERFYRVDKARSRAQGGTGLGLSIVKHIVTLHGGTVAVRAAAGGGSVFHFEIPRVPVGTRVAPQPSATPPPARTPRTPDA